MRILSLPLLVSACFAANTLEPPAAIKAEGVPAIPQEVVDELARYNETRSASLLDWHPLKRELLISTRFGDVAQIHRVEQPGGARSQLTFGTERVAGGQFDPASGRWFSYTRDVGGSEFYQLFVYDTMTGRSTMLSDGKSRNSDGQWSPDGKFIAHTSTRRNKKDTDIWLVDVTSPASARILLQVDTGGWSVSDWSPDGTRLIATRYTSATTAMLFEIDRATGNKRALTPDAPGVSYLGGTYSPDGNSIYVLSNEGSDFRYAALLDLKTGKAKKIGSEAKWDVDDAEPSPDGKLLACVTNEDGSDHLRVLDLATNQEKPVPQLPLGVIGGLTWRKGSHELGFSLSSAKGPADVYSVDTDGGDLIRWTRSEIGGLNAAKFVEPEIIRWKSFDGLGISGFYYKPPASFTGPRPVIINIHGGPEGQSRAGFLSRNNYYINELGIAMIFPNVRGSSGFGKKYINLDNGFKREDSVKDIGALLDWIATRPDLDSKRVMVTGGSYGGYMTLAVMTKYNDRVRCAVDVVGIANFVTFLENTESYRRDLRRVEYGDEREPKMRDFLLTTAPVKNVKKITKPMMIVQGRNDPRVPWTESQQMVEAIRENKTPVWYLLAADEGHGFSKKKNQDYQFAATVVFARQHLLD